jgi:hypothetical protein
MICARQMRHGPTIRDSLRLRDRRSESTPRRARAFLALRHLWVICALLFAQGVDAEEATVPAGVQVALLAKIASYDKNFNSRSGDRARILIVTIRGDADSERMSGQVRAALGEIDRVGGLPHDDIALEYVDAAALAKSCRDQRVSIVYVMPGLSREMEAIGRALDGASVLSVGAVSGYAGRGAVLDFFVEGGRPRIALSLERARGQGVAFAPEFVRITKVIE